MSRIGNQILIVPDEVKISIENRTVSASGPKGQKELTLPMTLAISQSGNEITVKRLADNKTNRSLHGLYRVLVKNLITGVKDGFIKTLEFKGIGYRVAVNDRTMVLNTGYSHPVELTIPESLKVEVKKSTISVSGNDKYEVGEFAAKIRSVRKPEVYKGKGIRYSDEHIKIKPGKTAAKGA